MSFPSINIPIEYKQIEPEHFNTKVYKVTKEELLEPNNDGYISDTLTSLLIDDKVNSNTTVINAGVGQGKSTAIIKMISEYCNDDNYIVVLAVPFKNLIEQYKIECLEFLKEDEIFDIQYLDYLRKKHTKGIFYVDDEDLVRENKINYKLHLLTVNALLGNPGEDAPLPAKKKLNYFRNLENYCRETNKKMILVFDEIHDAIHNFKEEYIYRLWNYQGFIHKTYVISATFNEASKEVIKYLSELTKKTIHIIESERKIIPKRQSKLYLQFYTNSDINKDEELFYLIDNLVNKNANWDMMVYSKKLVDKFLSKPKENDTQKNQKINYILHPIRHKVNKCTVDDFTGESTKYDPKFINIGTTFTTGINIKKEDHNYILILPKNAQNHSKNKGVFSNGTNSIIQALARQRTTGNIYIFLPYPSSFYLNTLPYGKKENQEIIKCFHKYSKSTLGSVRYSDINQQDEYLKNLYKALKNQVSTATRNIKLSERSNLLNRLEFPPKEIFILNKGEKFANNHFFSGIYSSYVLWASICNQFLNCKLVEIKGSNTLSLTSDNYLDDIKQLYEEEVSNLRFFENEFNLWESLDGLDKLSVVDMFFSKRFNFKIKDIPATDKQLKNIQLYVLSLIMNIKFENLEKLDENVILQEYLKSCIFYAHQIKDITKLTKYEKELVKYYKDWYQLVEVIIEKIKKDLKVENKPFQEFVAIYNKIRFDSTIKKIVSTDKLLSKKTFNFSDNLKKKKTDKQLLDFIYKITIQFLHHSGETTAYRGKRYFKFKGQINWKNLTNFIYHTLPEIIL